MTAMMTAWISVFVRMTNSAAQAPLIAASISGNPVGLVFDPIPIHATVGKPFALWASHQIEDGRNPLGVSHGEVREGDEHGRQNEQAYEQGGEQESDQRDPAGHPVKRSSGFPARPSPMG